jgi:hypothetical protein
VKVGRNGEWIKNPFKLNDVGAVKIASENIFISNYEWPNPIKKRNES